MRHLLGEGGQKTVYLARDSELERDVAIAVIKTHGLDDAAIARVRREAQTLAGLGAQPHIVTMYDIGQEEGPDGRPAPYFVCEYIAGGDLERELRRAGGPLPLERVYAIGQDLCRALEVAHSRGILHRDLKPGNVWLTEDGHAKLGDFGLAMALGQSRLTEAGSIMGTASYMPPEQALGTEVDVRGDLYALGCLLYELVTGRPPFLGDDTIAIVSQHINTAPVAASWHRADLPRALDALIERLLEKAPAERPESARAVLDALATMAAAPAGAGAAATGDATSLERLAGGVFVGREGETQEVRSALDRALSGQGNLLLLAGEPGIGKTRLAEELTTYGRLRGAQVLWGRSYEGEGAPAYWPWVQAIRAYVHEREAEALRSELGTGAADIAQVVSEVRERLPDLPVPASMEPEQARFRLFDSIATFLKNAANAQPVVFILDDLHWADKPSLLLLQFVARGLGGTRLLMVGTYRDVEVRRQHPLSSTLAELAREQLSQRVVLRGLSEGEVARYIEMSCGVAPPDGLVAAVHKDTEGNPFFVKEVVNLLAREGRLLRDHPTTSWTVAIPQSVREVVGRRLDGLSDECSRVLTIAAVLGREFDLRTLEQITDLPGDAVLDLLEETVAARIVDEAPDAVGRYSFSHGLIRETLYAELTGARRARFHRQIAGVLEQTYAAQIDAHLAELAYHFFEAARGGGDPEKAIDYATRAGERALSVYAWEEASAQFEHALETLELTHEPGVTLRCDLLLMLGEAQNAAGDAVQAKETLLKAAQLARESTSPKRLARAALGYVGAYLGVVEIGNVDQTLVTMLEEALHGLSEEDSALRARLMCRLAMELYFFPDSEDRREVLSREAVDMARRLGDRAVLIEALRGRHMAVWSPDNLEERLAVSDELMALAAETRRSGPAAAGNVGFNWRIADLLELGEMEAGFAALDALVEDAGVMRRPDQIWNALLGQAMRAILEGRYEDGERLAEEALAVGQGPYPQTALTAFGLHMGTIRRDQGRLGEMEDGLRAFGAQYPAIQAFRWSLPLLYSEAGREAEARSEFERLAAMDFADVRRDATWHTQMFLIAETCANLSDAGRAAGLYDMLLPYPERNVTAYGISCWGSTKRLLARLATTMQHWDDAEAHFDAALAWSQKIESPPWVARTQMNYAEMLLARGGPGDQKRAFVLFEEALATARQIGQTAIVNRCLALKQRVEG